MALQGWLWGQQGSPYFLWAPAMAGLSSRVMGMLRSGTSLCLRGALTVSTPSRDSDDVMVSGSTSSGMRYFLLNSLAMKPCSSCSKKREKRVWIGDARLKCGGFKGWGWGGGEKEFSKVEEREVLREGGKKGSFMGRWKKGKFSKEVEKKGKFYGEVKKGESFTGRWKKGNFSKVVEKRKVFQGAKGVLKRQGCRYAEFTEGFFCAHCPCQAALGSVLAFPRCQSRAHLPWTPSVPDLDELLKQEEFWKLCGDRRPPPALGFLTDTPCSQELLGVAIPGTQGMGTGKCCHIQLWAWLGIPARSAEPAGTGMNGSRIQLLRTGKG